MQNALPDLIEDLYQAIAEPRHWKPVLDKIASTLKVDLLALCLQHDGADKAQCFQLAGSLGRRSNEASVQTICGTLNSASVDGTRQTGEYLAALPASELKSTKVGRHAANWLKTSNIGQIEHAWIGDHAGNRLTLTLMTRKPAAKASQADQLAASTGRSLSVRALAPHLARCLRVGIDNSTANAHRMYGMLAIKTASFGVFHINASGSLGLVNPYGHEIASGNGLIISAGTLHATDADCEEELQAAIESALKGKLRSATSIRINRREGEFPLVMTISALPELDRLAMDPPVAIVLVTDPTLTVPPDTLPLQRLFGLTRAEAGVSRSIMAGKSIEECAEENGHSVATSRNLLKRAFHKTGTHRQSELSALLQCAFLKQDVQRLNRG